MLIDSMIFAAPEAERRAEIERGEQRVREPQEYGLSQYSTFRRRSVPL
jgi:hypothetical protein